MSRDIAYNKASKPVVEAGLDGVPTVPQTTANNERMRPAQTASAARIERKQRGG